MRKKMTRAAWLLSAAGLLAMAAEPPVVGGMAPDFSLAKVDGGRVKLSDERTKGTVMLVVLRGYPGYQCPFCHKQVQDFLTQAAEFGKLGVRVVLVYPGPGDKVEGKAAEFLGERKLPENFALLVDPEYGFTESYGLRWAAPRETAYPSTFLIDRQGRVTYAKVAREHGGRTTAAEMLAEVKRQGGM